ncbi:putative lipoprotein AcfD-like protein [Diplonema papillatum]|nr:putative lipoprotein AcfD-like protein [Diplonema papillatum]
MRDVGCTVARLAATLLERDRCLFPADAPALPERLPRLGAPGVVCLFGLQAFPLVVAERPGGWCAHDCIAAASTLGRGRVVVIAHEAYLDPLQSGHSPEFIERCVRWAGGPERTIFVRSGDDAQRAARHVEDGGGAVVAACPWGWAQLNPGKTVAELPLNAELLVPSGMAFGAGVCSGGTPWFEVKRTDDCRAALVSSMLSANLVGDPTALALLCADSVRLEDVCLSYDWQALAAALPRSLVALQRAAHHITGCHPKKPGTETSGEPAEQVADALAAYGGGGWWASATDHIQLAFDFGERVPVSGVEVWCVNVDASPKRVQLSAADAGPSGPWRMLADFAFQTRNNPGSHQNKPVVFKLESTVAVRHLRLDFRGIHNSHYVGINDVKFLQVDISAVVDTTATLRDLEGIPLDSRIRLAQQLSRVCPVSGLNGPSPTNTIVRASDKGRSLLILQSLVRTLAAAKQQQQRTLQAPSTQARFDDLPTLPGVDEFPGTTAGIPTPPRTVRVEAAGVGKGWWISLRVHANPRSMFTVSVARSSAFVRSDWRIRVGAHTDDLTMCKQWERWPSISCTAPFNNSHGPDANRSPLATVVTVFGGLVFLECVNDQATNASFDVTVEGCFNAPYFTKSDQQFVDGPAPWGEVEADKVILTLPKAVITRAANSGSLAAAADYWDAVVSSHHKLAAPPYGGRKERIVCDQQLSVGYMHSGYPIMAHLDFADIALDPVKLKREGSWGMFHELGHNMQRDWWTWPGTVEVTVNLFTLWTMDCVVHKNLDAFDFWKEKGREVVQAWLRSGRSRATWDEDAFLALYLYAQLISQFGWEALQAVFRQYETSKELQQKCDGAVGTKMRVWMETYSQQVGRNLAPFFEAWGFDMSGHSLPRELPPWQCDIP